MEILKLNNLAKSCMKETDYNNFMSKINNQQLNNARLFVENKIEELSKVRHYKQTSQYNQLKQIDNIVTESYINQIDVNAEINIK